MSNDGLNSQRPIKPVLPIKLTDGSSALPIHQQLKHSVLYAIGSGQLAPGDQLPSVRELATELKIAPNTVGRIYQELQEDGLLVTRVGRGTFVSQLLSFERPEQRNDATLSSLLRPAIEAALTIGFTGEKIQATVAALVSKQQMVVGVIGLNEYVTERWQKILTDEFGDLGIEVIPLTIVELKQDLSGALRQLETTQYVFSLITTYSEVRKLLEPYGKKVGTLITELSIESHRALESIPDVPLVGLICHDLYESSMLGLISPYVDHARVKRVAPQDEQAVIALLTEADVVLYTTSATTLVRKFARPESRTILLEFVPNPACFDKIRRLLQEGT